MCDQDRHGFVIIDLRTLFKIYYASSDTVSSSGAVALDGSAAVAYFCGGETGSDKDQFASPRGIAVDDTSNELYISDQMNHRVQVYAFSPVALADLKKKQSSSSNAPKPPALKRNGPVALSRSFGVKGHGSGQLQRPSGVDVSHYHVVVCDAGNSRLAVFAKRGAFVRNFGSKGAGDREFHDIRDVKLINVRKVRARKQSCGWNAPSVRIHLNICAVVYACCSSASFRGDCKQMKAQLRTNNSK